MKPRILIVHTFYQQKGGEDKAFDRTIEVLESLGFGVETLKFDNYDMDPLSNFDRFRVTVWNAQAAARVEAVCRSANIAAVHFHNTFPLASPAVYAGARRAGAKVLQWIHNYRLLCPNGAFFRDGHVCESCLNKTFGWPGIVHACYRGSRAATTAVATMQFVHRVRGTYRNDVDRYLVYTDFVRDKLAEGGIPAERIRVVPNLAHPDPGAGPGGGGYGLFVGRLAFDKGILLLLEALKLTAFRPFKIVGGGPYADQVRAFAASHDGIEFIENASDESVREAMGAAEFLVLPSLWYEGGGPLTAVEALARGTPMVVPRLGNLPYYAPEGTIGVHFKPADPASLAAAMESMMADMEKRGRMRHNARMRYVSTFTLEAQKQVLQDIMGELL